METIKLKPKPLLIATRMFLLFFAIYYLAKHCAYGLSIIHDPEFLLILRARAIEALVPTVMISLMMAIPFFRRALNIVLTETTLQAPRWKRGNRWKSITVDLSDISLSRTLRDRLNGTQIVTNDGDLLYISSFFYPPKTVSKLFDEIERRIEIINNPNQSSEPTLKTPGDSVDV